MKATISGQNGEIQSMREIRYADAGMDIRKLLLCFMRKIGIVLLAAAAGAILGGAVYAAVRTVPESEREYQAMLKIYLDFAADETGEVYQAYNGYTWNDLMATEPILDVTMGYLPGDYAREEVMAAVKAEILSDLRLLTITVTTHEADTCDRIADAVGRSLTDLGNTAKEFRSIRVIQTAKAKLVVADARWRQAILIGMVLASAFVLTGMLLYYVLDDRIMTASDLRQVTDAPFVGYSGAGGRLEQDYAANLACLQKKGRVAILSLKQREAVSEEKWQELCDADGVVISVAYGAVHAVYLGYIIEQFAIRECALAGLAIEEADGRFLGRYYGLRG